MSAFADASGQEGLAKALATLEHRRVAGIREQAFDTMREQGTVRMLVHLVATGVAVKRGVTARVTST